MAEREHSQPECADNFPWSLGLFDAHCHPTDLMDSIEEIAQMNATALTIMATRRQDQDLVARVARDIGISPQKDAENNDTSIHRGVVPSFGWHPWYSHEVYAERKFPSSEALSEEQKIEHYTDVFTPSPENPDELRNLPDPKPLSSLIAECRARLKQFPLALVGEVGLDRSFKLPQYWLPGNLDGRHDSRTPGGREGRQLSRFQVKSEHQIMLLNEQLRLAAEMQRPVSVHGVTAHGALFDTLHAFWKDHEKVSRSKAQKRRHEKSKSNVPHEPEQEHQYDIQEKPYPPRVCLHSYSGPLDVMRRYVHPSVPVDIFFSFSLAINFTPPLSGNTVKFAQVEEVIRHVPDDRLLIETDLHCAGEEMDRNLRDIAIKVCKLKNWPLDQGARQLARNWKHFVFGSSSSQNGHQQ